MRRNFVLDNESEHFLDLLCRLTGHSMSRIIRDAIIHSANCRLVPTEIQSKTLPFFELDWRPNVPRLSRKEIRRLPLDRKKALAYSISCDLIREGPELGRCVICKKTAERFKRGRGPIIHLHHEDYNFPERVTPMCASHHFLRHGILKKRKK